MNAYMLKIVKSKLHNTGKMLLHLENQTSTYGTYTSIKMA
jgi:hypothetical protein